LYSSLETWGFDTVKDVARKRTPWNVLEEINESLGRYGFRIQLVRSETHAGAVYAAFVNTRDDALAKDVKPCAPELYAGFKALLEALGDADAGKLRLTAALRLQTDKAGAWRACARGMARVEWRAWRGARGMGRLAWSAWLRAC
jgi:hypothetical protein